MFRPSLLTLSRSRSGTKTHARKYLFQHNKYTPAIQTFSTMSNEDAQYAAFLERSNKDYSKPSGGVSASMKASEEVIKTSVPEEVHPAISSLKGRTYTSDADEEFQPVSLEYEGDRLPSEGS